MSHSITQGHILMNIIIHGVVVLKELIFNSFYFRGCGGLERTDFYQFLIWEGVVVLKELVFNSFYFGGCGGFGRTGF